MVGELRKGAGEFGDDTTQGVAAISQGVALDANAPQDTSGGGSGTLVLPTVVVTGNTPATPASPPASPATPASPPASPATPASPDTSTNSPDLTIPLAIGALGLGTLALFLISRSK